MSERIILTDLDEQMQEAVADTRQRVAKLHAELPRWGLVVWTAGNVSERVVVDRGDVGGVVHTHSPYATAWAARREPIPCALTMMGDEFGGDIPIGPFALIGDDSIGRGIVETLEDSRSPAVLMANHGPFTVGKDARDAVKAAVMCEEVARTMSIAEQLGDVKPIPADMVDRLNDRYQNVYGQH